MASVVNGIKWTSFSAVVNACAKLAQIAVLTRFLEKEDFGLVAIALLVISFTEIFMDMGISSAVLHKPDISKNEYSSLYWFNIISGVIICGLICFAAPWISTYYQQPELVDIISLLSFSVVFSSISRLQRTFQQKRMQFNVIAKIDIAASILMVIFSILLAFNGFGVYSLVYSTLLYGFLIAAIYLFYSLYKEKNISFHFKLSETKPYLKIGIYQVGSSTLDYLSREMDVFLIGTAYSMEVLGAYSICKQLAFKVYSFINPIILKVMTPSLALCQNNRFLLKEKYLNLLRVLAFVDIPIYFFLCYASAYVLGFVYGESYVEYALVFSVLCVYYSICSIGNPLGALLVATGRTDLGFYWTIFRIVSTLIILYLASFGNILVFVLAMLLLSIVNIYPEVRLIYQSLLSINYRQYLKSFFMPFFLSFILFPISFTHYISLTNCVGIATIGGLFFFFYVLLSFAYNKRDVALLNRYLHLDRIAMFRHLFVKYGIK